MPDTTTTTVYVPARGMCYTDRTTGRTVKVLSHDVHRPAAHCRVVGPKFKLATVDYVDLVPVR